MLHSCALNFKDQDILDTTVNLNNSVNSVPDEVQGGFSIQVSCEIFCNNDKNKSFFVCD